MKQLMSHAGLFVGLAAVLALGGCAGTATGGLSEMTATTADFPTVVRRQPPIERALACIAQSGVLNGHLFAVGPFVDSTGKINAVAQGSTGSFLPQAGSASFITDTIRRAGGQVLVQYFGNPEERVRAEYVLNGIFNTLDFGSPINADVRVGGIGPVFQRGWAQLTLTIQMDVSATRINRQISMIQRPVRYTQIGVGSGTQIGAQLVTGEIQVSDQQRLQFEAVNGPVALGVIDVLLKEFPSADRCREQISDPAAGDRKQWTPS